jgi:hypothetical protein
MGGRFGIAGLDIVATTLRAPFRVTAGTVGTILGD